MVWGFEPLVLVEGKWEGASTLASMPGLGRVPWSAFEFCGHVFFFMASADSLAAQRDAKEGRQSRGHVGSLPRRQVVTARVHSSWATARSTAASDSGSSERPLADYTSAC